MSLLATRATFQLVFTQRSRMSPREWAWPTKTVSLNTVLRALFTTVPYTSFLKYRLQSWNRTGNLIIRPLRVIRGALVFTTTPGGAVDEVDDVNTDDDGVTSV